jgi:tetratricopeptide (TPR) repeat protein
MNIRDENLEKARYIYKKGDYISYYNIYEDLLHKNPKNQEVLYEYGKAIFSEFGDLEKAAHLFERSLAIEPDSVDTLLYLGALYSMGYGKWYPEALPIYQRIITLSSSNKEVIADAFIGIGMLHHVPDSPISYEEVIAAFRKAIEADPQRADAHQNLGVALLEGNKRQEAWKELKIAERLLKEMGLSTEGIQKLLHTIETNELFTRGSYINLSSLPN